jgi:hypothetical protein
MSGRAAGDGRKGERSENRERDSPQAASALHCLGSGPPIVDRRLKVDLLLG